MLYRPLDVVAEAVEVVEAVGCFCRSCLMLWKPLDAVAEAVGYCRSCWMLLQKQFMLQQKLLNVAVPLKVCSGGDVSVAVLGRPSVLCAADGDVTVDETGQTVGRSPDDRRLAFSKGLSQLFCLPLIYIYIRNPT